MYVHATTSVQGRSTGENNDSVSFLENSKYSNNVSSCCIKIQEPDLRGFIVILFKLLRHFTTAVSSMATA